MNEKYVVEYCSNCETENEFRWDVEEEGFKAYCPHCGAVLMLCDECVHRKDAPWVCTTESTPEREYARTIKMLAESEEHKMNYMEKVAEMLGVELGEKFTMIDTATREECNYEYYIDNLCLCAIIGGDSYEDRLGLQRVLNGRYKVIKLPWKPKDNETVFYLDGRDNVNCMQFSKSSHYDLMIYKLGKLYRTREEAEAHAEEDKTYWDEVRKEIEE